MRGEGGGRGLGGLSRAAEQSTASRMLFPVKIFPQEGHFGWSRARGSGTVGQRLAGDADRWCLRQDALGQARCGWSLVFDPE